MASQYGENVMISGSSLSASGRDADERQTRISLLGPLATSAEGRLLTQGAFAGEYWPAPEAPA